MDARFPWYRWLESFVELKLLVQTLDKRSNYTVSIDINSHENMYQGSVGFLIFIASKPKDTES